MDTKADKFTSIVGSDFLPYSYPNIWSRERTTGPERLVIAPSANHIELMKDLLNVLPEPFGVLYVLLVSRCDNELGRYQISAPCARRELDSFLEEFKEYFESDARHHLWVMSLPTSATLVYDQHNVIYAYGSLDRFEEVLTGKGLEEGSVSFPDPHAHNYHDQYDEYEQKVLKYWDWIRTPLQDDD